MGRTFSRVSLDTDTSNLRALFLFIAPVASEGSAEMKPTP